METYRCYIEYLSAIASKTPYCDKANKYLVRCQMWRFLIQNETPVVTIGDELSYRKTRTSGGFTHSGFSFPSRIGLNVIGIAWFVVLLLVHILFAQSGYAATFTVTRFDDIGIPDPRDASVCQPDNCTLREAINAANLTPGADTILVPAGTYQLRLFTTDAELQITDDVTIQNSNPSPGNTAIIDAGGATTAMRVLDVLAGQTNLVNIGVMNGELLEELVAGGGPVAKGGGIRVQPGASLTMTGGFVSNNIAMGTSPGDGAHVGQ